MKVQSNTYTFIYSAVIVVVVATTLAIVSTALKPSQDRNVEVEKKQNILSSLRISSDRKNAGSLYKKYITNSYTLNVQGQKVADTDPFTVDLRKELKKRPSKRNLPVFEARKGDSTFVVIPVYGKGLWGPIWGYVSFRKEKGKPRFNTIYGVMFDHKGETPGLGAEINQFKFMKPFRGKKIFDSKGNFVSVKIVKGGADPSSAFEVDAISGGTITSKGVQAMLDSCLTSYQTFFKK